MEDDNPIQVFQCQMCLIEVLPKPDGNYILPSFIRNQISVILTWFMQRAYIAQSARSSNSTLDETS